MADDGARQHGGRQNEEASDGKDDPARKKSSLEGAALFFAALDVLAVLGFIGGALVFFFFLPELSRRTYFSENAMMPAGASSKFRATQTNMAFDTFDLLANQTKAEEMRAVFENGAEAIGLEVSRHMFTDPRTSERKVNSIAVLRSPRADGKEMLVLQVEYPDGDEVSDPGKIASLSTFIAIMHYLATVPWLSKDIIFITTPSTSKNHAALDQWLLDYHYAPLLSDDEMFRGGEIWAAVCLEIPNSAFDSVAIAFEGVNGEFPNLDLVNVAVHIARRLGLRPVLPKPQQRSDFWERLGVDFTVPFGLGKRCQTLHGVMTNQAIGVATGNHGAFKPYRVEAISLVGLPHSPPRPLTSAHLERYGGLVEGMARVVSNILERFHQSFFFWLLTDTLHYVPVEEYLLPCLFLLLPLVVRAAAMHHVTSKASHWPIRELLLVGAAYALCAVLLSLSSMLEPKLWACASGGLMLLFPPATRLWLGTQKVEWSIAKAQACVRAVSVLTCGVACQASVLAALVLTVMAMLNFSSAAVAAILLVPLFVVLLAPQRGLLQVACAVVLGASFILAGPVVHGWGKTEAGMGRLSMAVMLLLPPWLVGTSHLLSASAP